MNFAIKILLLMVFALSANAQITLRFQPHITPHAQKLGDVLLISNDKSNLAQTPLDSHAMLGQKITKAQIVQWIKNKKGAFSYAWRGKKTAVIRDSIEIAGSDLIHKAESALRQELEKQKYVDIALSAKTKLQASSLPASAFTVQITGKFPVAKRVCVRLNNGKRSIAVWFAVKASQKILIARHKINKHNIIHASDFMLDKRNIAGLKGKPYTKFPVTLWLKKSINKDQILTQDHLTQTPDVLQGHDVKIQVLKNGISIITKAVAQQDGYIGQLIKMKNLQNNHYFVARITAENQAEITS